MSFQSSAASGGLFGSLQQHKRGSEGYDERRASHSDQLSSGGAVSGWFNKTFESGQQRYEAGVRRTARSWKRSLVVYALIVVGMGVLFYRLPSGFLPAEDQAQAFRFDVPRDVGGHVDRRQRPEPKVASRQRADQPGPELQQQPVGRRTQEHRPDPGERDEPLRLRVVVDVPRRLVASPGGTALAVPGARLLWDLGEGAVATVPRAQESS